MEDSNKPPRYCIHGMGLKSFRFFDDGQLVMFFFENKQLYRVINLEEYEDFDHKIVTAKRWTGGGLGPEALTGSYVIRFPKKCSGRCLLCQPPALAG